MKTLNVTAPNLVIRSKPALDLGAVIKAPSSEPAIGRFPGWLRVVVLFGGAAGLWVAIAWGALRLMGLA